MIEPKATIVVGLGFGDESKGTIVDYLTRRGGISTIVRFNGGAQAAHNVITPDGRHHTFQQFGSGTFIPRVRTHLSRFMLLDPLSLMNEARHLESMGCGNVFSRLTVDELALVVSPFHKAANRIREVLRGSMKHGSVGMGIGETMYDSIAFPEYAVHAKDLRDQQKLEARFKFFQTMKQSEFRQILPELASNPFLQEEVRILSDSDAPAWCADMYYRIAMRFPIVPSMYLASLAREGGLIFEGAQGVLLDEWHGFHPFTTWSTTTFSNALTLLKEIGYAHPIEKLSVLRAYMTRHGAGPFPTEDTMLGRIIPDMHNGVGEWQGSFRIGWLDMVLARYALAVSGGADAIALTNLDRLAPLLQRRVGMAYQILRGTLSRQERVAVHTTAHKSPQFEQVLALNPKPVLTDLTYQELLTGILNRLVPVYEDAPTNEQRYIRMIEQELNIPVTITSHGPTARDKHNRVSLEMIAA